jgi:hypothetical protein
MLVPHVRFASKKLFCLPKYNIISPWWPTCQLSLDWILFKMKLKMLKTGIEPTTPWSLESYTTSALLLCKLLCLCIILCVLILSRQHGSRTHLSGPVSMVVKFKLKFKFKFKLQFKFKFKFLQIYSKFESRTGPAVLSYWFYSKYCLNSNSNWSLNWNSNSSLSLNSKFSKFILNLAWI